MARTFLLGACASSPMPSADLAIHGVAVVDVGEGEGEATVREDVTVLIGGNRITAVGPSAELEIPERARVVEGAGGYLLPGLWDMHAHSAHEVEWHFPLYLAHGVTGIRDMNAAGDSDLSLTTDIKRRLAEGDLVGPRFVSGGASFDGVPQLAASPTIVHDAAEARAVDAVAEAGGDLVKVYETLSREAYFAVLEQAGLRGIPVDGHVPFLVRPEEAADSGQRTVEHLLGLAWGCSTEADAQRTEYAGVLSRYDELSDLEAGLVEIRREHALYVTRDPALCATILEAYRRNGVAATPTLVTFDAVVDADETRSELARRLVPETVWREWRGMVDSELGRELRNRMRPQMSLQLENVRLLREAGVTVLAGTDVGVPMVAPGASLHRELSLLTEAGLTPLESLRSATLNPARVLGLEESLGTVAPGRLADLVLLEANPLEAIANTRRIRAVVADGRLFLRDDLDRMLAQIPTVGREN